MNATRIDRGSTDDDGRLLGGRRPHLRADVRRAARARSGRPSRIPRRSPIGGVSTATTTIVEEMDVRVGGKWRYVNRADDREEVAFYGRVPGGRSTPGLQVDVHVRRRGRRSDGRPRDVDIFEEVGDKTKVISPATWAPSRSSRAPFRPAWSKVASRPGTASRPCSRRADGPPRRQLETGLAFGQGRSRRAFVLEVSPWTLSTPIRSWSQTGSVSAETSTAATFGFEVAFEASWFVLLTNDSRAGRSAWHSWPATTRHRRRHRGATTATARSSRSRCQDARAEYDRLSGTWLAMRPGAAPTSHGASAASGSSIRPGCGSTSWNRSSRRLAGGTAYLARRRRPEARRTRGAPRSRRPRRHCRSA